MFGSAKLLRGHGQAIEFGVDSDLAAEAIEIVLDRLDHQRKRGRMLLGAIGIRFVKGSRALLAPNLGHTTCFIELPCIRTKETVQIFRACAKGLEAARINFGCHWGLYNLNTAARVEAYWGARATAWRRARRHLLSKPAQAVFESPLLYDSGLE